MSFVAFLFSAVILATLSSADHEDGHYGTKVGTLRSMHHGVQGIVYALDEHTIIVKDFEYDGAGPDAFFWVGTEGEPTSVGTILPYPFDGKFYEYEDQSAPILTGRFNKVDVKLTLPDTLKTTSLKWFSVWCRAFKVNFADVTFPANFKLAPEGTNNHEDQHVGGDHGDHDHGLPPPLKPPTSNSQPGHHDHGEDPDVEPEGGAKHEPSKKKNGASSVGGGSLLGSLLSFVVIVAVSRW